MKKIITLLAFVLCTLLFASTALAGVTIKYYNKDSVNYELDAVCSGSKKKVKFGSSRTAAVTIQGSAPCKVTLNGKQYTFKGGESIRIHKGVITFQ
ncbi:MAG: hypothetical protein MJE77_27415 [Proteobacteria bacterium]|nr:hypothetical protein [Pseudomonadota bacterium]